MKVLVTGGAGYIGAHVAKVLIENSDEVTVLDDLSNSDKKRIQSLDVDFIEGSIQDAPLVFKALQNIDLVIHCAAHKSVEESVRNPAKYQEVNYWGTNTLLNEMVKANVKKLIFSSTAAVYGNSVKSPISEDSNPQPISIYGKTKLRAEELIGNYCASAGITAVSLRFFNAVGAANHDLADTSTDNLFPKVFSSIKQNKSPEIFGDDYPTPDGTCIRDYIHVQDIAEAHLVVAGFMNSNNGHHIFNVGTGKGYSVKDIISGIQLAVGTNLIPDIKPRRQGDLDVAFADTTLIKKQTGWSTRFDLSEMIESAWKAWQGK